METPEKKELITEIAELFKAHEQPYEMGSWEDFSKQRKKRRAIPFAWIGAAAALLLVVSVLPFVFKSTPVHQSVAIHKEAAQKSAPLIVPKDSLTGAKVPIKDKTTVQGGLPILASAAASSKQSLLAHVDIQVHSIVKVPAVQPGKSDSAIRGESIKAGVNIAAADVAAQTKQKEETAKEPEKKQDFLEYLRHEGKSESTAKTKSKPKEPSRWDFGVEVSPTMLQSKMNVGGGITTEYRLSKNFSLSSGIAYVALDAGKNITPPTSPIQSYAMAAESNKKLVSVQASIQAIDIPISLTYNVNKSFYTSVGVSYFGVFDEKRGNKYLTQLEVSESQQDVSTGKIQTFQAVVSEKNNEVATDLPLKGNSYLGFFNFSVGHKQEIFSKYKIVVEPFLKVPVGKLSNQDLKLTNGGVKLKFTF